MEPRTGIRGLGEYAGAKRAPECDPIRVCPRCGQLLQERSCKLICLRCGYYLSCSDF